MKTEKLQDMGMFSKGLGIKKDEANSGDIPAIRYGEIYTNHHEVIRSFRSSVSPLVAQNSRKIRSGDILFACSGETKADIGKCVAFTGKQDAYAGGDIIIFSPNKDILDSTWLGYYLNAPEVRKQKSAQAQGDAVVHISMGAVAGLNVTFPSLVEQQNIATVLSDIDALIETQEALIAKKKDVKAATMELLLTGKTRLLGSGPSGAVFWEKTRLGRHASFYKGRGLPKSDLIFGGQNPCIHYGELFTKFGPKIEQTISATNIDASEAFLSKRNDVLMPTSDVTPTGLAKASCITSDGIILGGDILVIRGDDDVIDGVFLSYVIRQNKAQIQKLVTGSTVYHLYGSDMARFEVLLPPLAEQQKIAAVLCDMDAFIETQQSFLIKLKQRKIAVMHKLLTGEIRLP